MSTRMTKSLDHGVYKPKAPGNMRTPFDALRFRNSTIGQTSDRDLRNFLKAVDRSYNPNSGWLATVERFNELYQQIAEAGASAALSQWFREHKGE